MDVIARIADPEQTVVPRFEGRAMITPLAVLLFLGYFLVEPSDWCVLFHWRWLTGAQIAMVVYACLRSFSWSPIYAGPTVVIGREDISGRGGWGQAPWKLNWHEVDHFESSRGALKVYRKGQRDWQSPILQRGFGGRRVVKALECRLRAYAKLPKATDSATAGE